ncbi:MAG: sugar nucleotide-binding protein [Actinobacteria bacterium]|nr:sugar nucleotide-binding protein [Actinomycetota bacterium]
MDRTAIPGLLVVRLPLHRDERGWFKESWQREKMVALGLPDFAPVQSNLSFNTRRGATRGIHAEPWDKLVTLGAGRVFAAWVDLRAGETFGRAVHLELDPSVAVYVPRGVANSYQSLDDGTVYTYLVDGHWRPGVRYPALHLGDESAAIPWPIPLAEAQISAADRQHPRLVDLDPVPTRVTVILGADGQLGRALGAEFPDAVPVDVDVTDEPALARLPWSTYDVVLNAAAYTAVDPAETPEGRRAAWAVNAAAPAALARLAAEHRLTLVHYSSDYVFDGTAQSHHEQEPLSPLGVYAQSKAAGDLAVATTPRHYLLRTSWLVGQGRNFVRTMLDAAERGISPAVVDDQVGRLTFADELARATRHLLDANAAPGTYNVTNGGDPMTWWEIATHIFRLVGRDPADVRRTSAAAYAEGTARAPRPACSVLDLAKLEATGFSPELALTALARYVAPAVG